MGAPRGRRGAAAAVAGLHPRQAPAPAPGGRRRAESHSSREIAHSSTPYADIGVAHRPGPPAIAPPPILSGRGEQLTPSTQQSRASSHPPPLVVWCAVDSLAESR